MVLQEGQCTQQGSTFRNSDISVETASPAVLSPAVIALVLGLETDGAAPAQPGTDFGMVYTYTFTAAESLFRLGLSDNALGTDNNATLAALTLEVVPEPSRALLLGLGVLSMVFRRSRP